MKTTEGACAELRPLNVVGLLPFWKNAAAEFSVLYTSQTHIVQKLFSSPLSTAVASITRFEVFLASGMLTTTIITLQCCIELGLFKA